MQWKRFVYIHVHIYVHMTNDKNIHVYGTEYSVYLLKSNSLIITCNIRVCWISFRLTCKYEVYNKFVKLNKSTSIKNTPPPQ